MFFSGFIPLLRLSREVFQRAEDDAYVADGVEAGRQAGILLESAQGFIPENAAAKLDVDVAAVERRKIRDSASDHRFVEFLINFWNGRQFELFCFSMLS